MLFSLFSNLFQKYSPKKIITNINLIIEKLFDLKKTNLDLGLHHLNLKNINDAIFRFKLVIFLDKNNSSAYYNLGRTYLVSQEPEKAKINFLKSLKLDSELEESKFFLDILENKYESIKYIPNGLIQEYYDMIQYDNSKLLCNDINNVINHIIPYINENIKILDLGCSIGQVGYTLISKVQSLDITGIDISKNSIKFLKASPILNNVYNKIIEEDFYNYLKISREKYDMVIARNSLCYKSDLLEIFNLVESCANKKGLFVFTLLKSDFNTINIEKKYFTFSKDYLDNLIAIKSWKTLFFEEVVIDEINYLNYVCELN